MINFLFSHCAVMSFSATISKLVHIIPALHQSHWFPIRLPISPVLKPHVVLMLPRHCNMIKPLIHVEGVAFCQLIMTSLAKQFTNSQILSMMQLEKIGTDVYFTHSLNHWPQRRCNKNASIGTPRIVIIPNPVFTSNALSWCNFVGIRISSGLCTNKYFVRDCGMHWKLQVQILINLFFSFPASELNMPNLTYRGWDKMAANFMMTFSSAFPWMNMYEFRIIFHGSLFLMVQFSKFLHWFK